MSTTSSFPAAHFPYRPVLAMDFNLSVDSDPPETRLTLQGELDLVTSPVVAARLYDEIEAGCRRLLVDLDGVTFVDGSALTMFTQARRAMHDHQGTMEFVAFQPLFLSLCQATGLVEVFGLA
jgi:anti-sigma B factor antagonist